MLQPGLYYEPITSENMPLSASESGRDRFQIFEMSDTLLDVDIDVNAGRGNHA